MRLAHFNLRTSYFAAWSLAVVVAMAGCGSDPTDPGDTTATLAGNAVVMPTP